MSAVPTLPYIGSKISLISNSEIRYEGILYTINTHESTVALQNVRSYGTEGRRNPDIPPSGEVYDFIIFRGKDIKDVTVSETAKSIPDDPAIVSMNIAPNSKNNLNDSIGYNANVNLSKNVNVPNNVMPGNERNVNMGNRRMYGRSSFNNNYNYYNRGGGGGGGGYHNYNRYKNFRNYDRQPFIIGELESQPNPALKNKFSPDFDFNTNNSKFDKSNILDETKRDSLSVNNNIQVGGYDKNASFFDNISCETLDKQQGKDEKVDKEKLRMLDVDTFGIAAAHYRAYLFNNRNKNRNKMRNNRSNKGIGGGFNYNYYNNRNSNTFNRYVAY